MSAPVSETVTAALQEPETPVERPRGGRTPWWANQRIGLLILVVGGARTMKRFALRFTRTTEMTLLVICMVFFVDLVVASDGDLLEPNSLRVLLQFLAVPILIGLAQMMDLAAGQMQNHRVRGEVARWRGGEVARWRGGEVARWRGGEVANDHDYDTMSQQLIRLIHAEGTTAAMSKVDAHHHIWDRGVREQSWMVGPAMDPLRRASPSATWLRSPRPPASPRQCWCRLSAFPSRHLSSWPLLTAMSWWPGGRLGGPHGCRGRGFP